MSDPLIAQRKAAAPWRRPTAIASVIAGVIGIAASGASVGAQSLPSAAGTGTWQYHTEQDLAKATIYVADYKSATTSLAVRCGGLGGSYVTADIGFRAQFLPEHVNVQFDFHKKDSPADDTTVDFDAGTVEHGVHIGGPQSVMMASGGLMRFDQVSLTISDPRGTSPPLRAEFPLAGARDVVRTVFRNCEELKGADPEGLWDAFAELQRLPKTKPAKKP